MYDPFIIQGHKQERGKTMSAVISKVIKPLYNKFSESFYAITKLDFAFNFTHTPTELFKGCVSINDKPPFNLVNVCQNICFQCSEYLFTCFWNANAIIFTDFFFIVVVFAIVYRSSLVWKTAWSLVQ